MIGAATVSGRELEVVEVICDLLLGIDEGDPPTAFFGSLCEAICRLTSLERAVLFSYDPRQRRVAALGAYGLEVEPYFNLHVTIDSVPVAKQALEADTVLEVVGGDDFQIPPAMRRNLEGLRLVCTPMQAAGRCVGVVIGDRGRDRADPISEEERLLLKTLGKAIAMAVVAREVTRYHERSKQLAQRIDFARQLHEAVIQRLFAVSLALSASGALPAAVRTRCAEEVEHALKELRTALQRPLAEANGRPERTVAQELERQAALCPKPPLVVEGNPAVIPPSRQGVCHAVLVEALRNARKHAKPTTLWVRVVERAHKVALEVENDGVGGAERPGRGIGLQVLALEARMNGGTLTFGRRPKQRFFIRLELPGAR